MSELKVYPLANRQAILLYGLLSDFEEDAGLNNIFLGIEKFLVANNVNLHLAKNSVEYTVLNNQKVILLPNESVLEKLGV